MPHTLTLTWHGPFEGYDTAGYIGGVQRAWVNVVEWHQGVGGGGGRLGGGSGIYVIENAAAAVYAGRATSVNGRFKGRSATLHDFLLTAANSLPHHQVYYADVASAPGWFTRVVRAERWLVRFLYRLDALSAPRLLQNRDLVNAYPSPGGLTVQWSTAGPAPAYLTQPGFPGYGGIVGGMVQYNHPAGTIVLP